MIRRFTLTQSSLILGLVQAAAFGCGGQPPPTCNGNTVGGGTGADPCASGGGSVTGGASGTGGSTATGGSPGTGGQLATGGSPNSGGQVATGGSLSTGGQPATGGSPATGGDQGTGGAVDHCVGVTCTALDQCHTVGLCDSATGICTNPAKPDHSSCSDGNACTTADECLSGVCTPGPAATTEDNNPCTTDACDPTAGVTHTPVAPGTSCADANACNGQETCDAGGHCTPGTPVVCAAIDACHLVGTCDSSTGVCTNPVQPDGAACEDGNPCTTDSCLSGACTNHVQLPNGSLCNDSNACTRVDVCENGSCTGANPVVCVAQDECHLTGACDTLTGTCSKPVKTGSICVPLPPDPVLIAPPLDMSVATNIGDATQFLYTGSNPIQTGVASGTIDRAHAAVLRGRVQTREGDALPGVTITVKDHPEFGSTRSRADGAFDMAVNGGGYLTLNYKKDGYLPAQRQVQTPWLDYVKVPDAALIPLDPIVTTIDLTANTAQSAKGSLMVDASGARRMTLFFNPGTQATMTLPDCSTQTPSTLNVRATEYTVGPNGPAAMPAALPATSGYTYAVELSADEAIAAATTRLDFSQPVVGYVENFLGFSDGTPVPIGFYDLSRAQWVPADSGLVVRVLNSLTDLADLDTDGDGLPDSPETLANLGITADEQQFLKTNYVAPSSLWRVQLPHFSDPDCNWPILLPPDATPPNQPPPQQQNPNDDADRCEGCIIEAQNQTLGESIAIAGTPYSISYSSDRVPGRASVKLKIPVSGLLIPGSLKSIQLMISAAGETTNVDFLPAANQDYTYVWHARDPYNRAPQGQIDAEVTIQYTYDATFGSSSWFGNTAPNSTDVATRFPWSITQGYTVPVEIWDARGQGIGGWTLNAHHVYDPQIKTLRLGDGSRRTVDSLYPAITTSAGTGAQGYAGDGGPAKNALLSLQSTYDCGRGYGCAGGVVVAPNGGQYIADFGNCVVRWVRSDGVIETIAGSGTCDDGSARAEPASPGCGQVTPDPSALSVNLTPIELALAPDGGLYVVSNGSGYGYDGLATAIFRLDFASGTLRRIAGNGRSGSPDEGIAATDARLRARDVAIAPDGAVYIADTGNNRIRRVGTDGIITTVAGDGTRGFSGDGGYGTLAQLAQPVGVAAASDGMIYIADRGNSRIRRLRADGYIEAVAGGGTETGEGVPAQQAALSDVNDLALANDGSIYFAESIGGRVRRVTPAGRIETVAGGGDLAANGEMQGATRVQLMPSDMDVAPDGNVFVLDLASNRIRRIAPPMPAVGRNGMYVASSDGNEIYTFDQSGRHRETLHALTGATLLKFEYDAGGRLASVTDGDGNPTTIQHDSVGNPTSIRGPFGQVTQLSVDSNGYLSKVSNAAGETTEMTYTEGGLLKTFKDPRGGLDQYAYDDAGRLIQDTDATGASKSYSRVESGSGYQVVQTSAAGRKTTFGVQEPSANSKDKVNTRPDGTKSTKRVASDNSVAQTSATGVTESTQRGPDPRFGMQVSIPETSTITTLDGLSLLSSATRTVDLADPANPLSLKSQEDTFTRNGLTSTNVYTAASHTFTRASAQGRQVVETIDSLGRIIQRDVTGLVSTFYAYEPKGRLSSVTQGAGPDQRITAFAYDDPATGQLLTVTDPLGRVTKFLQRNTVGRVLKVSLPGGREVDYTYDANSNVTSVTPPGQPQHEFSYTAVDLVLQYKPPSLGAGTWTTGYSYSPDRELTQVTRPDAATISYSYDATNGHLTSINYPAPSNPMIAEAVIPTYDGAARVKTLTSGSGEVLTYTYDGSLVVSETWSGPVSGSAERQYDNNFRVIGETVNGANAVSFAYDYDGLLTQAGELALGRDPGNGQLISAAIGGVVEVYGYNPFGELSSHSAAAPDASTLFSDTYQRDKLGRITQKAETVLGTTATYAYTYDDAGRLASVSKNGTTTATYDYDLNGNRTSVVPATGSPLVATYDAQDRLISYAGAEYTYTANGELFAKATPAGTTTYAYDVLGNLRKVALPDGTVMQYQVDGKNRRVGKKVNGTLVQAFIYENALSPLAELDGAGNIVSRFVYGTKVNVPEYMIRGGTTYRIITDQLGSPRLVVNVTTGAISQQMNYDEWGVVLNDSSPGFQPFGFAGGTYDRQSELLRFGARDYDPSVGRWNAKDSGFIGGNTNLFLYAFADALNKSDPFGRDANDVSRSNGTAHVDLFFPPEEPKSPFEQPYSKTGYCELRDRPPPPPTYLPPYPDPSEAIDAYNEAWENAFEIIDAMAKAL